MCLNVECLHPYFYMAFLLSYFSKMDTRAPSGLMELTRVERLVIAMKASHVAHTLSGLTGLKLMMARRKKSTVGYDLLFLVYFLVSSHSHSSLTVSNSLSLYTG